MPMASPTAALLALGKLKEARDLLAGLVFARLRDPKGQGWADDELLHRAVVRYRRKSLKPESRARDIRDLLKKLKERAPFLETQEDTRNESPKAGRLVRPMRLSEIPLYLTVWMEKEGKNYIHPSEVRKLPQVPYWNLRAWPGRHHGLATRPGPIPPLPLEPRVTPPASPNSRIELSSLLRDAEETAHSNDANKWVKNIRQFQEVITSCTVPPDDYGRALLGRLCLAEAKLMHDMSVRWNPRANGGMLDTCRELTGLARTLLWLEDRAAQSQAAEQLALLDLSEAETLEEPEDRDELLLRAHGALEGVWTARCAMADRAGIASALFGLADVEWVRLQGMDDLDSNAFDHLLLRFKEIGTFAGWVGLERLATAAELRALEISAVKILRAG